MFLIIILFSYIQKSNGVDLNCQSWLNQHLAVKNSIKWTNIEGVLPYDSWTSLMKSDLQTYVNQLLAENNLNFNNLPQLIDVGNGKYLISPEAAWYYYVCYVANSIVTDELDLVPWKLNDLSDYDLDMLFNSKYMLSLSITYNLYSFLYITPASPRFVYNFLESNSLIGPTRYNTICRVVEWCKKLSHYYASASDDPSLDLNYIHWQYSGPPPVERIINGTVRLNELSTRHWTEGCHGTVEFIRSLLQTLNIPVQYVLCAGHAQPYFTSESLYLSHGDDPYNANFKYSDIYIPPSKLLINGQTYIEMFGDGLTNEQKENNIGFRTLQLGVEYLSIYLCKERCLALKNNITNQEFMQNEGLDRIYTLNDLNAINFWNNLDNKIGSYGGCSSNSNFSNYDTYFPNPRSGKEILDIWFNGQDGNEQIDQANKKIIAQLKLDKDITNITPHISISEGATISPLSGVPEDFTNKVIYEVKAENGISNIWEFTIISPIVLNPNLTYGTVTDIDANVYKTIQIGAQTWMAENLKTTKYNDGNPILDATNWNTWYYLSTDAYCWYNNDPWTYKTIYGALYNWYAVNTGKLCPLGWHVPSYLDWGTLTNYLGGIDLAGGKIKEPGITHWTSPNAGATNESGFTALPNGIRNPSGSFSASMNGSSLWWSESEGNNNLAECEFVNHDNTRLSSGITNKTYGFSIRCIQDIIPTLTISPQSITVASTSGSTANVDVTSNTSWTVTNDATWLTVSPTSGSGNGSVTVTTSSANTTTNPRSGIVTFSASGVSSTTVIVTQSTATSNSPPNKPILSTPSNKSNVDKSFTFSWQCTDPDVNDVLNYTIRFRIKGTNDWAEELMHTQTHWDVTGLDNNYNNITFEWCIVASDGEEETISDIWEFTVLITNIIDIVKNFKINVYPNPAKDFLIIDLGIFESRSIIIKIFEINGTLIYKESIKSVLNNYKMQVNLSDKKPGTYIVKIKVDNTDYIQKFIKE